MNNQLSNISTQYRKFSKGQYIKHPQFNEFLDFFEDQDRLSRVLLQGVGVVCGFEPQLIYANNFISKIQLSQGVAITTDGDLLTLNSKSKEKQVNNDLYVSELKTIKLENKQYTHFKVYDNSHLKYPHFYNINQQIDLFELATAEEATAGFLPLRNLADIENKCLMLYLESYEKEIRPCKGVDCDNHGVQQIRNLKVLLTSTSGASTILKDDKVSQHPVFFNLVEEEKMERVILDSDNQTVEGLRNAYARFMTEENYIPMFKKVDILCGIMNFPLVNKSGFAQTLEELSKQGKNFQYAYEVLKDLSQTYTEIAKLLPTSFTKCLPDLQSFPKHILLGKLNQDTKFDLMRYQFYNSPVLDNDKATQRLKVLVDRFTYQVLQFKKPASVEGGIVITPSQKMNPLEKKAIPFYYELTDSFLKSWSFDKSGNRKSKSNLSFDKSKLSSASHIQNPIGYNIDKNSFYRIEGHQGFEYKSVIKKIKEIKDKYQLGFDLMALSLAEMRNNKDLSKANFSEYVEKNPGLEFSGGVKPGGTFGVVYESEDNPVVVADFSLPYICCTPKSDVRLSLPVSTICENAAPLLFVVSPLNGVVKAEVVGDLSGGVQNINGQYVFDPKKLEKDLLGQEIKFTVNGKPTSCVVTVVAEAEFKIKVGRITHPEAGSKATTVSFVITGENFDQYDYRWDFLSNGNYIPLNPDEKGNIKYTYFNLDPKKIPSIKVVISGNGCSQTEVVEDWYKPQVVENNIPPTLTIGASHTTLFWPSNSVKLSSQVSPGNGTITSYLWTSVPNNVSFFQNNDAAPGVTFPAAGTYTISLTVKDSNNLTATKTITITVGTKVSITGVNINLVAPTSNDVVNASASVSNPNNIGGLKFDWYLDGVYNQQTATGFASFGKLAVGEREISVQLSNSDGGNHFTEFHSVKFNVTRKFSGMGTSFLPGTLISLSEGTPEKIENIRVGDKLKSFDGIVNVLNVFHYESESNLYRLNENDYFITEMHPVKTEGGWKSFDPAGTNAMISGLDAEMLREKDILIREDRKNVALSNVSSISGKHTVYNLEVDGSKEYFANGYLVYSEIEDEPLIDK